jgi:hypothetical protein
MRTATVCRWTRNSTVVGDKKLPSWILPRELIFILPPALPQQRKKEDISNKSTSLIPTLSQVGSGTRR